MKQNFKYNLRETILSENEFQMFRFTFLSIGFVIGGFLDSANDILTILIILWMVSTSWGDVNGSRQILSSFLLIEEWGLVEVVFGVV